MAQSDRPVVAREFRRAPEVEAVAIEAIRRWHGHLMEARIAYLMRSPKQPWVSKGRTVMGKVYKLQPHQRALVDVDFILVTNTDAWKEFTEEQRLAYVDHELSHCESGEDKDGNRCWTIADHDVEDFAHVVQRHGLWQPELKRLGQALEMYQQGRLFTEPRPAPASGGPGAQPTRRERRARVPSLEAPLQKDHPGATVTLVVPAQPGVGGK